MKKRVMKILVILLVIIGVFEIVKTVRPYQLIKDASIQMILNDSSLKPITSSCLTIDSLKNNGYLKKDINLDGSVIVSLDDNRYSFVFQKDCNREDSIYKEDILKGSTPKIKDGLIPVVIDSKGEVRKANIYNKWYSYKEKNWANAVMLNKNINYSDNEVISEDNIKAYFVWIPRYRYKIFNSENSKKIVESKEQEIEIEFEDKSEPISSGTKKNVWVTHSAFTSMDVNGMWVAKFEANGIIDRVTIKPNTESISNENVKTMFEIAYKFDRTLNSHMMKNTEWAAVAYLSHSKYGINNQIIVADKNDKDYVSNYKNSTTGNITGIYEMSGGLDEYVAGFLKDNDSIFTSNEINKYDLKYFDVYDKSSYSSGKIGDATKELGPFKNNTSSWYEDSACFPDLKNPWFIRGGNYQSYIEGGQFSFDKASGNKDPNYGFRIVLN